MTKRGFGSIYQQRKRRADGTVTVLPTWWIKYSKNGHAFRESSGSHDEREAGRLLKRRLGEVVTGKFAGLTLSASSLPGLLKLSWRITPITTGLPWQT